MDNYKKGKQVEDALDRNKIPIPNLPDDFVWMQVLNGSKMRNLLNFAMKAMDEGKPIVWTGSGPALGKAISCAEILKRKYKAHQISKVCYHKIEEHWDPCLPELDTLIVKREIPMIHIFISKEQLDINEAGYQAPGKYDAFWKSSSASQNQNKTNSSQTRKRAQLLKKFTTRDNNDPSSSV